MSHLWQKPMSSRKHHSLPDKTTQFYSQKRMVIGCDIDLLTGNFTGHSRSTSAVKLLVCAGDGLAPGVLCLTLLFSRTAEGDLTSVPWSVCDFPAQCSQCYVSCLGREAEVCREAAQQGLEAGRAEEMSCTLGCSPFGLRQ